jgi:Mg/Co/Ni transporter MgtE
MDWVSFDLPWDGTAQFVSPNVDRDAPTCRIDDKIGEVRARVSAAGLCVVVYESGVVAGSLDEEALHADNQALVETVMKAAPATVRLTEEVSALEERLRDKHVDHIVVTRPDGRLVGVFRPPIAHGQSSA